MYFHCLKKIDLFRRKFCLIRSWICVTSPSTCSIKVDLHEALRFNRAGRCNRNDVNGIVGLDPQVQSDHYEDFYAPELEKHGYTGVYKKKTGEVRSVLCFMVGSLET